MECDELHKLLIPALEITYGKEKLTTMSKRFWSLYLTHIQVRYIKI